jgi:hypothetical protein
MGILGIEYLQVVQSYSLLWLPSQRTGVAVCLQPQKYSVLDSVASNFTGVKPLPLWLPSQNGCVALRPQAHQK